MARTPAQLSRTTARVLRRLALIALIGNAGGSVVVTSFAFYLAPCVRRSDLGPTATA
jgi:hypothetical protein